MVNKADGRSTFDVFLAHFRLDSAEVDADFVIGDNQQGVKEVAAMPGAIGYVSIGAAEVAAKQGTNVRLLPLEGVEPSVQALEEGRFPLSRPLNVITYGEVSPLVARTFLNFAQSADVDDLVEGQHLVPLAH